jgi:hypothetical protein
MQPIALDVSVESVHQSQNVRLSPEASEYFKKKGCKIVLQPTPEAIRSLNGSHERKIGLMHVTC